MNEKVKSYLDKAKEVLGKIPKKLMILAGVLVAAIAVAAIVMTINRPYAVLFGDLDPEDVSTILAFLEEEGITDYILENGDTILVPENQEPVLKARIIMQSYPDSGFGYSTYYDNVSALSTESERNNAYLMSVQDRMGAVIECLDGVDQAVVSITQGEDRIYVLDSSNVIEATASVVITMKNGQTLSKQQAEAIRNLVAYGVQGLAVDSVKIVDSYGNLYSTAEDYADADASALKFQLEEDYNNRLQTKVMQVLQPFFGEGHVQVSVTTTVDVRSEIVNSKDYHVPETSVNGQGLIGSMIYNYSWVRDGEDPVGGVPGTSENSDIPIFLEPDPEFDGTETEGSMSGQNDFLYPSTDTYVERSVAEVVDCTIAVSVDSTIVDIVDLDAIRAHAANAAGITATGIEGVTAAEYLESKISVISMPFYQEPIDDPLPVVPGLLDDLPPWLPYALIAAAALLLILIVVIIVLVRRGKKRKLKRLAEQKALDDAAAAAALEAEIAALQRAGADVMTMQSERSMELRKDVRDFADTNPEIAAQLIRLWLKGGEENG